MNERAAVVAIGGNAILRKGDEPTMENQLANLRRTSVHIARMVKAGYDVALTHGNGPQVGAIVLQNEAAGDQVPPMPLDACVAESQGLVGYMLQQALADALRAECCERAVTCVLTRVVVDANDEAFRSPSKPIGPYYTTEEAGRLAAAKGWTLREDPARGGWRRAVPSPRPRRIVEGGAIMSLMSDGRDLVISAGGGGIPMVEEGGRLRGVEAVVDKDLAAACLAKCAKVPLLVLLTDVDQVFLDYGKAGQRAIDILDADGAEAFLGEGQFPPGTMGPKIEAAIGFVRSGGARAVITRPELLDRALQSKAGTQIVR